MENDGENARKYPACPGCGEIWTEWVRFCPGCGAPVPIDMQKQLAGYTDEPEWPPRTLRGA